MSSEKEATVGLPQLGVSFLADSNRWNKKGTSNFRTVRQMLKKIEPPGF